MADIFVSYARQDRHLAAPLIELFEAQGWTVWWDREIGPGAAFRKVIEGQIAQARCVVVLWTARSVESDWVIAEASEGLARRVLMPVLLEDVSVPLVFRQTQACDLHGWPQRARTTELNALLVAIAATIDRPVAAPSDPRPKKRSRPLLLAAATAFVALATTIGLNLRPSTEPAPTANSQGPEPSTEPTRIAVQPFRGMDADVSFEVARALAALPALQVTGPNSSNGDGEQPRFVLQAVQRDDLLAISLFDESQAQTRLSFSLNLARTQLQAVNQLIVSRVAREFNVDQAPLETSVPNDTYLDYLSIREALREQPPEAERAGLMADLERIVDAAPRFAEGIAALCREHVSDFRATKSPSAFEQAERHCARAARLDPMSPWVDVSLGDLYLTGGQLDSAEAAFTRALEHSGYFAPALGGLARVKAEVGDAEQAQMLLARAIDLEPSNWRNYATLAELHFVAGDFERAAREYEAALERSSRNANMLSDVGSAYFMLGRLDEAIERWEASIAIDPSPMTLSNVASAYYFEGRFDAAVEAYERAIAQGESDYRIWLNAGEAAYHSSKRAHEAFYRRAIEIGEEVWRINPDSQEVLSALALAHASIGDVAAAQRYIEALKAFPELDVYALYDLAATQSRLGERAAMRALLKALRDRGYPSLLIERDPSFTEGENS